MSSISVGSGPPAPMCVRSAAATSCCRPAAPSRSSTSLPTAVVTIEFRGRIRTHDVQVELATPSPAAPPSFEATEPATQYLLEFTKAERRILTALCEPLLVDRGDKAKPASYAQAAERIFLSRSRVENCVSDLVRKFAGAGVPNLEGPEAKDNLCRYAVRSGSINQADLALLEQ